MSGMSMGAAGSMIWSQLAAGEGEGGAQHLMAGDA